MSILKRSWDLEIVACGALGVCRFDDLQKHLGISRKVLSERLKVLTEADVLERCQYQAAPDRFEYLLTDKGRDLLPIHVAIMEWHVRWRQRAGDSSE
ncbi:MAG: winged helix-turn-helix transcriptional regulator [Marmoricola sp.]